MKRKIPYQNNMLHPFRAGLLIFIGFFTFSSCQLEAGRGFYFDETTFTSEWNAWQNQNLQNYSFTLTGELHAQYFRALPMREYEVNIIVKNGSMESFQYIGDVPHWDGSILEPEFTSIPDMYQKIAGMAKAEKEWWKENSGGGFISTTYVIEYDPQLHYMTFFEPVDELESGWIVDTTLHAVTVSNFTALGGKWDEGYQYRRAEPAPRTFGSTIRRGI